MARLTTHVGFFSTGRYTVNAPQPRLLCLPRVPMGHWGPTGSTHRHPFFPFGFPQKNGNEARNAATSPLDSFPGFTIFFLCFTLWGGKDWLKAPPFPATSFCAPVRIRRFCTAHVYQVLFCFFTLSCFPPVCGWAFFYRFPPFFSPFLFLFFSSSFSIQCPSPFCIFFFFLHVFFPFVFVSAYTWTATFI